MDKFEKYLAEQEDQASSYPGSLRELAYTRLKDAIRHTDLQPGEPLSETRLSELLGISRTPVREALRQLAQEGLVQIIPGRAVTVASLSIQEVLNVVHVRLLLEPELARLSVESISPGQLDRLQNALREMEEAAETDDRMAWSKADTQYHEVLSACCPNELLGELVLQMRNRVHHVATDSQTTQTRLKACTQEHRQVYEAIAAKDPKAAEGAMREHINQLRTSLFNRLTHE